MKIYLLTINKVDPDPSMISSNYRATRHQKTVEYWSTMDRAEKRRSEIYEGLKKLVGFIDGVEVTILEIEVRA